MKVDNTIIEICNWINTKDVFWLKDLKETFSVPKEAEAENLVLISKVNNLISRLKKLNHIQCCENNGSYKQYIVIKRINPDDLFIISKKHIDKKLYNGKQ